MSDPLDFPSLTPRFALPLLFAGQAQKEFTVNEALSLCDSLLHGAIEGEAAAPPATPGEGECWRVGAAPSGEWAGHAGDIACLQAGSWLFVTPRDGLRLLDRSRGQMIFYRDGWNAPDAPALPGGGATIDVEARTVINGIVAVLRQAGVLPAG